MVTDANTGKAFKNGAKNIKGSFDATAWQTLCGKGYVPRKLSTKGDLLQVAVYGNKTYFIIASTGRPKEIIEDLNVRYITQPQFTIAVWNDDKSTLQIRGMDARDVALTKVHEYLSLRGKFLPHIQQLRVEDKAGAKSLAKELGGTAHRGKFVNRNAEIEEATLVAQAHRDLWETKMVKKAEKDGYSQDSAGIDFVYKGEAYTVWVAFSAGTFWVRAGAVTEELVDFLHGKLLKS